MNINIAIYIVCFKKSLNNEPASFRPIYKNTQKTSLTDKSNSYRDFGANNNNQFSIRSFVRALPINFDRYRKLNFTHERAHNRVFMRTVDIKLAYE